MSDLKLLKPGSVSVVTGAALGIGLALSHKLAESGVSVVMADLPGENLDAAYEKVRVVARGDGATVTVVPTDVSQAEQIQNLHDATVQKHEHVDLLVNNAVTRVGRGIDAALSDWQTAMDVNLWGPVNGVRTFLPTMLKSAGRRFIVNVGSKQGITNPPGHPIYNMTKSALKTYTEALEHELRGNPENQSNNNRLSAHLLVPGWTTTGTAEHKPGAWLPSQVVDRLFDALSEDKFYVICPDGEVSSEMDNQRILWGAQDITENRPPLSRWHPDYADDAKSVCG